MKRKISRISLLCLVAIALIAPAAFAANASIKGKIDKVLPLVGGPLLGRIVVSATEGWCGTPFKVVFNVTADTHIMEIAGCIPQEKTFTDLTIGMPVVVRYPEWSETFPLGVEAVSIHIVYPNPWGPQSKQLQSLAAPAAGELSEKIAVGKPSPGRPRPVYMPGVILVGFREAVALADAKDLVERLGYQVIDHSLYDDLQILQIRVTLNQENEAIRRLESSEHVAYAEREHFVYPMSYGKVRHQGNGV